MSTYGSPIVIRPLRSPSFDRRTPSPTSSFSPSHSTSRSQSVVNKDDTHDKSPYRGTSSSEHTSKYKNFITSERLAQLRKIVEEAIKEHRVFTIRG